MSLAARLTRTPRPHDPDAARHALEHLPWAQGPLRDLLAGVAGCSPYLRGLIKREADWLHGAADAPEDALAAELAAPAAAAPADLSDALRQGKRRVALLTALADLGGVWPLEQVTQALTDFADAACQAAFHGAVAAEIQRGKLPGASDPAQAAQAGLVVFAMGKMGAGELNYSSDIDLICLFDECRFDPANYHEARASFVRATRRAVALLSDVTGGGYVFRTDLRLRPDPAVTPVCLAMEAAERYYESLGRTWERAAWIKARPCAGDLAAGQRFQDSLRPFVWRRHLDFAAIEDAHNMRLAIREHKGTGGAITLSGHNMKLGRGGIREIEFFTQTRQLIAGGRDPDLRLRGTVPGLAVLADKGWVPAEARDALTRHYRAHREVEHRLQMINDAQTHSLPTSDEGFARLAALMDTDPARLRTDLRAALDEVHRLTERFFAPDTPRAVPDDIDRETTARWLTFPALRSERAVAIFNRLKPDILRRLNAAARPDEARLAFEGFLQGLPAGVQLFSLFEANPQLVDLLIDVVDISPELALYLSRNAGVFDAVIGGAFFSPWPGRAALEAALAARLAPEDDYERRLDAARRWGKEWHFRIGVHLLRGLTDACEAATQYSDLAEAALAVLWPVVQDDFARKHGPCPGRGAVVLGMGSLGAGRLHARSDLDLIVVYDPASAEVSDGPRPLAARTYYARLTQALVTAMSAPTAAGRLYEIDMRLRPSGNQGPVATSLTAFRDYQTSDAWTWEHLALTRARAIAGPPDLCADVEAVRRDVLARPADRARVLAEVAEMRARIAAAKGAAQGLEAKLGQGRLQDIELTAQTGALLAGDAGRSVAEGLQAGARAGWLSPDVADRLAQAGRLFWSLQTGARLISAGDLTPDTLGVSGAAFLRRLTGLTDEDADMATAIAEQAAEASSYIDAAFAPDTQNRARP